MNPNPDQVLVCGAGIAGAAVTLALHRRGIPVYAFDRRTDPVADGLAINLPGNAIAALDRLGFAGELSRLGRPVRRRVVRTERDRTLFEIDEDAFWGDRHRPRCVRRSDLLAMLWREAGQDTLATDVALTAAQSDGPTVDIELSDGTRKSGGFLIGADGVGSVVRRTTLPDSMSSAAVLARASWRFMAPNPGVDGWTLWTGAGAMKLLIPVSDDEVYGWAAMTRNDPPDGTVEAFETGFRTFPGLVRRTVEAVLQNPTAIVRSPLEEVRIPRWHSGRIALIGDSAHATAPVWAQGAALALEDAEILSGLLADAPPAAWTGVGSAYEDRRRPRVAHVQAMTDRMSRSARLPDALVRLLMPFVGPRSYRVAYGPLRQWNGRAA